MHCRVEKFNQSVLHYLGRFLCHPDEFSDVSNLTVYVILASRDASSPEIEEIPAKLKFLQLFLKIRMDSYLNAYTEGVIY